MGYKEANAMRYEASPEAIKRSMGSLGQATKFRREAPARKSDAFFADANQGEQDYLGDVSSAPPAPRRPSRIKPSSLSDVLKDAGRTRPRPPQDSKLF